MTDCGIAYLMGEGVERSSSRGLAMIGMAAGMGSEHACQILGRANAEGRHGFDKNPHEATWWYREMKTCKCRNSNVEGRRRAAARAPVEILYARVYADALRRLPHATRL